MEKRLGGGASGVGEGGARRAGSGCSSVAATGEPRILLLSQQVDWAVHRDPAIENVCSGIGATHLAPPN